MAITLDGTNGITTPTYGGADTSEYLVPVTQFKNRIINGAMVIDQRNAGASVTNSSSGIPTYILDRWGTVASQASKFTIQQNAGSVTPPVGFINYLGVTSSSAYSRLSTDYFGIVQPIEGLNISDLNWGSANASTVTISFWVRSSLTGTFAGRLANSASNRSYVFTYSISSANTWEQKTVTITGDTTGTWLTTNGVGIAVWFDLGSGSNYQTTAGSWQAGNYAATSSSTSVVGTNGATFYITGVQLEVGSTATSFDYRPYGTELALCQRYYYVNASGAADLVMCAGYYLTTTNAAGIISYPVTMRTTPSLVATSGTNYYKTSTDDLFNSLSNAYGTNQTMLVFNNTETAGTAGYGIHLRTNSASASVAFSAEL